MKKLLLSLIFGTMIVTTAIAKEDFTFNVGMAFSSEDVSALGVSGDQSVHGTGLGLGIGYAPVVGPNFRLGAFINHSETNFEWYAYEGSVSVNVDDRYSVTNFGALLKTSEGLHENLHFGVGFGVNRSEVFRSATLRALNQSQSSNTSQSKTKVGLNHIELGFADKGHGFSIIWSHVDGEFSSQNGTKYTFDAPITVSYIVKF